MVGMPAAREHCENAARDLQTLFQRLIAVRVDAERDRRASILRLGEFGLQKRDRVSLVEELGFEIQSR